jgi:hypothetical protein
VGERWHGVQRDHRWTVEVNRVQERAIGFRVVGGSGGKTRHRLLTLTREKFLRNYRRKG